MDGILDEQGRPTFIRLPVWVVRDVFPRLTTRARDLYIILSSFADSRTGTCYPSRRGIAKRFGISSKTIQAATAELVDADLIQCNQYARNQATLYTLAYHPDQFGTARSGDDRPRRDLPSSAKSAAVTSPDPAPPVQDYLFKDELTGHAAYIEAARLLEFAKVNKRTASDLMAGYQPEQIVEAARNAFAARDMAAARGDRTFNPAGYLIATLRKAKRPIVKSNARGHLENHHLKRVKAAT